MFVACNTNPVIPKYLNLASFGCFFTGWPLTWKTGKVREFTAMFTLHTTSSYVVQCRWTHWSNGTVHIPHVHIRCRNDTDRNWWFIFCVSCRMMSYNIVRGTRMAQQFVCKSCRTTSSGVVESSDVVRHHASRHPALSSDVCAVWTPLKSGQGKVGQKRKLGKMWFCMWSITASIVLDTKYTRKEFFTT